MSVKIEIQRDEADCPNKSAYIDALLAKRRGGQAAKWPTPKRPQTRRPKMDQPAETLGGPNGVPRAR
jgi:hypothetical protein